MMAIIDNKTLRVQGKVEHDLLNKFLGSSMSYENDSEWFFIDYSPSDFPVESKFDLFFSSTNRVPKSNSNVLIKKVYDSFGHLLKDGIPKGFKTVVQLTFPNKIPVEFQTLPILRGWKPSSQEVLLTTIGSFRFDDFPELIDDLIRIIIAELQEKYYQNSNRVNKKELLNRLTNEMGLKDSERLLTFLTYQGFFKQENNEQDLVLNK